MRRVSTTFMLLLCSTTVRAQTSLPAGQFALPTLRDATPSCPVRLSVNRRPQGAVVWTSSNLSPARHGQGLHLSIDGQRPIVAVDVVVHGYPAGGRLIPAMVSAPEDVTETFHLTASADHPLKGYALWTERLAAVNHIELTRIVYADGTTWQASSQSRCSASPNLLVLVGSVR